MDIPDPELVQIDENWNAPGAFQPININDGDGVDIGNWSDGTVEVDDDRDWYDQEADRNIRRFAVARRWFIELIEDGVHSQILDTFRDQSRTQHRRRNQRYFYQEIDGHRVKYDSFDDIIVQVDDTFVGRRSHAARVREEGR